MKKIFEKSWNHKENEEKIYQNWEKSGYFKPEINMVETTRTDTDKKHGEDNIDPQKLEPITYHLSPNKNPFVIAIPPPNVTGALHIGHALFATLQDIMTRYHRLQGQPTLWIPGTDHAGIATQTVVDKMLKKQGINRLEIGRDKFLEHVWQWKEQYGGKINQQLRAVGSSCDWSRERFTMDEGLSRAVNEAFVHLYNKGLIYRGEYIVNWCPKCGTAIADDEVEYVEQKSKLYYFKYDKNFPITIATTRPETKFGDTAVAVNPSDKRYKKFIGQKYQIYLDGVKREIEIIADRAVDSTYGTGAVGVTPSHSAIDWRMAEEHNLPKVKVIDERGRMTAKAGEKYQGLKTLEAREKLVEYLKNEKLLEKEQEFDNNLSVCYRCNTAIEPIPSLQWFVKMKPLAENAKAAVKYGQIKIIPQRFEKVYFHWMDNIRDWCISRQLWWGHRIPVWYKNTEELKNQETKEQTNVIARSGFTTKQSNNEIYVGTTPPEGDGWVQDEDVLDTWFSSGLWPFSTLGWPLQHEIGFNEKLIDLIISGRKTKTYRLSDKKLAVKEWCRVKNSQTKEYFGFIQIEKITQTTVGELEFNQEGHEKYKNKEDFIATMQGYYPEMQIGDNSQVWVYEFKHSKDSDLNTFYPTTVMETGYDILFFWVARMIMMGLELTGKVPFETVYLHGLVRDEKNRKMSKSLNNGIDPLEVIEKYGADALRMALVVGATPGQDIPVGENKIRGYRNFSNKIWNASRFVSLRVSEGDLREGTVGEYRIQDTEYSKELLTEADKKVLKVHKVIKLKVKKYLDEFKFSLAGETLYDYFWHTFCDVYIEAAKEQLGTEEPKKGKTEKPHTSITNYKLQITNEMSKEKSSNNLKLEIRNLKLNDSEINTKKILIKVLSESLVMLHPFVPYVTEAVWQELRQIYPALKESIIIAPWPE